MSIDRKGTALALTVRDEVKQQNTIAVLGMRGGGRKVGSAIFQIAVDDNDGGAIFGRNIPTAHRQTIRSLKGNVLVGQSIVRGGGATNRSVRGMGNDDRAHGGGNEIGEEEKRTENKEKKFQVRLSKDGIAVGVAGGLKGETITDAA